MKRLLLTLAIALGFASTKAQVVCCNVVDGSGQRVVTTNGLCVVAPNLPGKPAGCMDSDGDGISDADDQCPEIAGTSAFGGCLPPDADGDGVADADDKCPNEAGTLNGCPDADGDGIADTDDECPDVAGKLNGCPDADNDGIVDAKDDCPEAAGAKENGGCPDSDGDGIVDKADSCPNEAGIAANKGCPELEEATIEALKHALEGVKFKSGSDVLTSTSYANLDEVVEVLKSHDGYKLKISGYTDNTGDAQKNLELSDKRAHAAEKYIISQGIDASRVIAKGYGVENPVATNDTAEGRAKNRRVEFEIEY